MGCNQQTYRYTSDLRPFDAVTFTTLTRPCDSSVSTHVRSSATTIGDICRRRAVWGIRVREALLRMFGEVESLPSDNHGHDNRLPGASGHLGSHTKERRAGFYEAILRGDLAAALVELESIGLANGPIPEYWHALAAASARMGMDEVRVRLDGWGGRGASIEGRAEPGAAGDRRGHSNLSWHSGSAGP